MDDVKEYGDMRNAMDVIEIPRVTQDSIFRLVAGILHIGNMTFYENEKGNAVVADQQGM